MNEITAAIKKKAGEKYEYDHDYQRNELLNVNAVRQAYRDCYTCGGEDAIVFMLKFVEWMGEEENPFMIVKGRWFQACGNSTSWTTEQLLLKYMEDNKL